MIQIRKTAKGGLEATSDDDTDWLMINRAVRVVEGKRFQVRQFINAREGRMIIGLNAICMQMLRSDDMPQNQVFFRLPADDFQNESVHVHWNGPVFIVIKNISDSTLVYLTNERGECLSGSNTWENGRLCLNSSFNPFNLEALDALIYNKANHDLCWAGERITGEWEPREEGSAELPIFTITTWPSFGGSIISIPKSIIEEVKNG